MWAYETLHYSGRSSTWGANARGLREVYFLKDPDELYSTLVDKGVTHILIDFNMITTEERYHTSLYTTIFVQNVVSLIKSGKAEMIYPTEISKKIRNSRMD